MRVSVTETFSSKFWLTSSGFAFIAIPSPEKEDAISRDEIESMELGREFNTRNTHQAQTRSNLVPLTSFELFQKGQPISKLFPLKASNGIVIEQQNGFHCSQCESAIAQTNIRGFLIHRDKTVISHLFCQCSQCEHVDVCSDAYEERFTGVSLWQKSGSEWQHTQDIDIPVMYLPQVLWLKLKSWLSGSAKSAA